MLRLRQIDVNQALHLQIETHRSKKRMQGKNDLKNKSTFKFRYDN